MVAACNDVTDSDPQFPCSPRSFAKAHLDSLLRESAALNKDVLEFSQDFDSQADEPESLRALRSQSSILSAEVQNLERVFQNATSDSCKQAIWDAVQRALRKRHLAELVSLRAAASFSERVGTLPELDHRARRKHTSSKSSDNASSTEMPLTSMDSDDAYTSCSSHAHTIEQDSDDASPTLSNATRSDVPCRTSIDHQQESSVESSAACSDALDSHRSSQPVSMENSYIIETVAPPKPMAVPSPKFGKFVAPETASAKSCFQHECNMAPFDPSYLEMPSPICPDLRTPRKLPLPIEYRTATVHADELDQHDIRDASCLSMSIEDWLDPELRQMPRQPSQDQVKKKRSIFGDDIEITAMEEDVQAALEVLGFRRCKGDEEESNSLLSAFWPLF